MNVFYALQYNNIKYANKIQVLVIQVNSYTIYYLLPPRLYSMETGKLFFTYSINNYKFHLLL